MHIGYGYLPAHACKNTFVKGINNMANPNVNLSLSPQLFEVISRDEAEAKGLRHYFTGTPCRNGHIAQRYVSTMGCKDCLRRYTRVPGGGDNYMDPKRVEILKVSIPVPKGKSIDDLEAFIAMTTNSADEAAKVLGWHEGPGDILRRCLMRDVIPFKMNRIPGRRYNNT